MCAFFSEICTVLNFGDVTTSDSFLYFGDVLSPLKNNPEKKTLLS